MKFALLAALASCVAAKFSHLPHVPDCSLQCFTTTLSSDGCNGITDFNCHCSKPQLASFIQPCVIRMCKDLKEQLEVVYLVQSICEDEGEPLSITITGVYRTATSPVPIAKGAMPKESPRRSTAEAAQHTGSPKRIVAGAAMGVLAGVFAAAI